MIFPGHLLLELLELVQQSPELVSHLKGLCTLRQVAACGTVNAARTALYCFATLSSRQSELEAALRALQGPAAALFTERLTQHAWNGHSQGRW